MEVYELSSSIKTSDLENLFRPFSDSGLYIKWLDDTRALAVFSTSEIGMLHLHTTCHISLLPEPLETIMISIPLCTMLRLFQLVLPFHFMLYSFFFISWF